MDRLRIFDRAGVQIDEARATVERGWGMMTETSAFFRVSVNDAKCNPFSLNYGNLILVENSDGLPDWIGVIDGRGFERGACALNAFSPERYFTYRRGPTSLMLRGTAGEIFAQMINYINGVEETILRVGTLESNVKGMQETLHPTLLIDNLKRIVSRSGEGYRWRTVIEDGQLAVYGDWYAEMAFETGLILHDGWNINGDQPLSESAPINDVLVYGNGTAWTDRPTFSAQDAASREEYGLRQFSKNVATPSRATLAVAGGNYLRAMRQPLPSFSLNVLNVGDTFAKVFPGAAAELTRLVGIGFSGDDKGYETDRVKVISTYYSPSDGFVKPTLIYEASDD